MKHDLEKVAFINRMRSMMEAAGERPTAVAREIGCSQANMSLSLNGRREPSWNLLVNVGLELPCINPLYILYGGSHEVLRADADYMPLVCKHSARVLDRIMLLRCNRMDVLQQWEGLEDLQEVMAQKRNFSMRELRALHELYPEFSVFWLITYSGPMRDAGYAKLRMKIRD